MRLLNKIIATENPVMIVLGAIGVLALVVGCFTEENWLFYVGLGFLFAAGLMWMADLLTPVCGTLTGAAHVKACG